MDLADLPPEVFQLIVQDRLSPEDLNQVSRTNRRLHDYLRRHADFIWGIFLKRDYPSYAVNLPSVESGSRKAFYLNLRKALAFCHDLFETIEIPLDNLYVPIVTRKIVEQYTHHNFLPLNALFDDYTPGVALAKLQFSARINAFLDRVTLDFRVVLDETQRQAVRLVMTAFLRAHVPLQSLTPIFRTSTYVVTGVTMRLLPHDLRGAV